MAKRHLQIRLVRDDSTETPESEFKFPIDEVNELVTRIFVGIGALIVLNTLGKIAVYKVS